MTGLRQSVLFLAAILAIGLAIRSASAQNASLLVPDPGVPIKIFPQSPVAFFRNLLAMSPDERGSFLTNRPPEVRARILSKVREYQALDPDERELRLQATELRWYLTPLLASPPTNREAQLANVPDHLRAVVRDRLVEWDILPPPLKQEFLENDRALHYFARIEPPNPATRDLSDGQRQKIAEQFNQFFELTPVEKEKALTTLSGQERVQMEKTLQSFDQMPPSQRALCLRNYAKFAGMSLEERADFLKNAERWSQMTPAEREAWRDLVEHVPQWPPIPPNLIPPPMPPLTKPTVATN
jgi:hypothetical protein